MNADSFARVIVLQISELGCDCKSIGSFVVTILVLLYTNTVLILKAPGFPEIPLSPLSPGFPCKLIV